MSQKQPRVLVPPPEGSAHRHALELKLEGYWTRRTIKGKPWNNLKPEMAYQFSAYRDLAHKIDVFTALLMTPAQDVLNTRILRAEMVRKYGRAFDAANFERNCEMVEHYLEMMRHMPHT